MTNGGYLGFGHQSFVMESAMMFSGQVKGRLVHSNFFLHKISQNKKGSKGYLRL